MSDNKKLRCAIYTRKSSEEGLDQAFNSLDAQREACAAYIASQASLGWRLVPEHYDDGGISGGTLERPSIQRLLQHIKDGKIDVIVVYKIDRLTRSLADFAKLVEVFDAHAVSFVSVTQQFNTTTSMGRLTLNVLLSFAQFEREVTAERIRDKIAATKQKGIFVGGHVSLGYRLEDRKLLVDEAAADHVRYLFARYLQLRSVSDLAREIAAAAKASPTEEGRGETPPHLKPMTRGHLRHMLGNPIYIGKLRHRDKIYDGEHQAIVAPEVFEKVQALLAAKAPEGRSRTNVLNIHPLLGLVFDETGDRLAPTHAHNHGKRYRYYTSSRLRDAGRGDKSGWRIPADELERIVLQQAEEMLQNKATLSEWLEPHIPAAEIERGLAAASEMVCTSKDHANPKGQKHLLQTLFERITLSPTGIRFAVRRHALVHHLLSAIGSQAIADEAAVDDDSNANIVVIDRPMAIKRRGAETRMVINGAGRREPDTTLVDLIARAHHYLNGLTDNSASSIADLAVKLSVHRADISRILPLAFLSPAITEAILTGRQPADLTAKTLSRLVDIPPAWADQALALGFSTAALSKTI
jgi:DNA invertase Pin-like site-specific DNA recombinase